MIPTIRDVASKANVSFQLAAAVLGRKKYARASEHTKEKIFSAAEALGYVPNASARILRGGASRIIGVLIDSQAPESTYKLLAEVEHAADLLGYRILTAQAHDKPEKLLDSYHALRQNGVDGIISFSHDYAQFGCHLDRQLRDEPKIVFVLNTDEENPSAVDVDLPGAMAAATEHLRSRGYRKTALVLHGICLEKLTMSTRKRLEGFRRACPEGEVFVLPSTELDIPPLEKECRTLVREKLLPGGFDSAITMSDLSAVILMNQLMAKKVRIPQDFGVIGSDDRPVGMCFPVKLTTLHFDRGKLASAALKLLLDKIAGKTEPVRITLPMKLIVRESTKKKV